MQSLNQKTERYLNDINYHLEGLKAGIETLQIDYNRDKQIFLFCEKAIEKINVLDKLLNKTNLSSQIKIATKVNELFILDENLSMVTIQLVNTKRNYNPSGIAHLKLTL
jgi:hypothetical protein